MPTVQKREISIFVTLKNVTVISSPPISEMFIFLTCRLHIHIWHFLAKQIVCSQHFLSSKSNQITSQLRGFFFFSSKSSAGIFLQNCTEICQFWEHCKPFLSFLLCLKNCKQVWLPCLLVSSPFHKWAGQPWEIHARLQDSLWDSFFIVRFIFCCEIHFSTGELLVTVSDGRVRFICFGSICLKKNPKLRFSR